MAEQIQLCEVPKLASIDQSARPSRSEEYVRKAVVDRLYPEIASWLKGIEGQGYGNDDETEVKEDLLDVLRMGNSDGYELAKDLDRNHGWACDSALVDILDDTWSIESKLIRELTKQWVEVYQVKCRFLVGDQVKILSKNSLKNQVGVVTKIQEEEATCGVRTSEQVLTSCWVVNFEDLEPYAGV